MKILCGEMAGIILLAAVQRMKTDKKIVKHEKRVHEWERGGHHRYQWGPFPQE